MRLLLVEDEKYIAIPLEQLLKQNHYNVDVAFDGEEGLYLGLTDLYDIIILDIMLPKMNGIDILKTLRQKGIKTPILMLTAKSQIEDRIKGLDCGADDYLPKPFDHQELLARLRALIRRGTDLRDHGILQIGQLKFDPHTLTLCCDTHSTQLTLKESQLLEILMKRPNQIVPKEFIIDKLWSFENDANSSRVEYHISLLRKKIRQTNANILIQAVRGVGYALREDSGN